METARTVRLPGLPEVKVINGNSARVIDATRVTRSSMRQMSNPQQMPSHQMPQSTRTQVPPQAPERLQPHRYKPPVVAAPSTVPTMPVCSTVNCTASSASSCFEIVNHVKRLGDRLEEISKQLERFNETLWLMHNNQTAPILQTDNIAPPHHHQHQHQHHHISHNHPPSPNHLTYPTPQSNNLHRSHQPPPSNHSPTKQTPLYHQQTHSRPPQATTSRSPQPSPQPVARHFSPAHKYHLKTPQSLENIPLTRKHTTSTSRETLNLPTHRTISSLHQRYNNRHSAPVKQYVEEPLADVSMASKEYLIRNNLQCSQSTNPLDYY